MSLLRGVKHDLRSPQGHETLTAVGVQEVFTAEPAEGTENTQSLSVLGVLLGERLLSAMFDCFRRFLSSSGDQKLSLSISNQKTTPAPISCYVTASSSW